MTVEDNSSTVFSLESLWSVYLDGHINRICAPGWEAAVEKGGLTRDMFKSCRYCGRIHPGGYVCPKKLRPAKHRNSKVANFRKTYTWQKKREDIVRRDFYLCRVCNEGSYDTFGVPGLDAQLQVHHIEPLEERFDLRLDDDNLVTCCSGHHQMAEDGDIPRAYLHTLAVTPPRWG